MPTDTEKRDERIYWLAKFAEFYLGEADAMAQPIYGTFHGGDPRNFTPDPECSTEEERRHHQEDCNKWERAERDGIGDADCQTYYDNQGKVSVILTRSQYGLGTNCDGEMQEVCYRVGKILDDLNPWRPIARLALRAAERTLISLGIWNW